MRVLPAGGLARRLLRFAQQLRQRRQREHLAGRLLLLGEQERPLAFDQARVEVGGDERRACDEP